MPNTNLFVSFPQSGTQTVPMGISRIDFIRGRATLANGSIIPLTNRSTQLNPLQSLFIYTDINIDIKLLYVDKTIYNGLILAGSTNISNINYDLLLITTSANTEIYTAGSIDGGINAY